MSRWDADLQQWVEDDPPGRGGRRGRGAYGSRAHSGDAGDVSDLGDYRDHGDPEEPEIHLLPGPPDGLPEGPSHAAILAGALAGVVLAGGLGMGVWSLLRDDGADASGHGGASPGPSASGLPTPGPSDGFTSGTSAGTSSGTSSGLSSGMTSGTTSGLTGPTGPTGTTSTTGGFGGGFTAGGTGSTGTGSSSGLTGPGSSDSGASPAPFPGWQSAAAPPAGYERTEDPAGFRADVPSGWERSTEGASVFFRRSDGNSLVQVFTMSGPEPTPYAALEEAERGVSHNNGYRKLWLTQETGPTPGAAELAYSYVRPDGTVRRVVDRAFTGPDHRQYALLVAGPEDEWPAHEKIFRVLLGSFCPSGYCASSDAQ